MSRCNSCGAVMRAGELVWHADRQEWEDLCGRCLEYVRDCLPNRTLSTEKKLEEIENGHLSEEASNEIKDENIGC